jgi:hypothetical protein
MEAEDMIAYIAEMERADAHDNYTAEQIEEARAAIKRAVMIEFGGALCGPALVGVDVSDADAIAYLNGATVAELLAR